MPSTRKPAGRPTQGAEAKRHAVSCRVTPAVMERLDGAIAENGRSLAQEIEQRLEQSIAIEDELGGAAGLQLFRTLATAIRAVGGFDKSWQTDSASFVITKTAINRQIDMMAPMSERLRGLFVQYFDGQMSDDAAVKDQSSRLYHDALKEDGELKAKAQALADKAMDDHLGISGSGLLVKMAHGRLPADGEN